MYRETQTEEVNKTYSATKPKTVVLRVKALCCLFIYRNKIPLRVEGVGVFEHVFASHDVPVCRRKFRGHRYEPRSYTYQVLAKTRVPFGMNIPS